MSDWRTGGVARDSLLPATRLNRGFLARLGGRGRCISLDSPVGNRHTALDRKQDLEAILKEFGL